MIEMEPDEIEQLLAESRIGRLSMADPQGRPYTIPLPFCWTEGALYLRLPLTGRKGEILRCNDRVCFEVDSCSDNFDEYASVLVEGRLVEVNDSDEKARVHAVNTEKYQRLRRGHRPGHGRSKPPSELPLRKIRPERLSGRRKEPATVSV